MNEDVIASIYTCYWELNNVDNWMQVHKVYEQKVTEIWKKICKVQAPTVKIEIHLATLDELWKRKWPTYTPLEFLQHLSHAKLP